MEMKEQNERETQVRIKLSMHSKENCLKHFESVKHHCVVLSEARQPLFGLSFLRTFETLFGSEMDFVTFKRNLLTT